MASRKTNQRFMAWSIVAIVLLLATSAWLYWNNIQLNNKLDLFSQELAAVESTQVQLEKDYELALASLEQLKGDNKELNKLIDQQKAELREQKDKISDLIWKSRKLDEAKKEINNLKNQALEYAQEINRLKTDKENLLAENTLLKTKTENLEYTLETVSEEKAMIAKEKDSIAMVKEKLKKENVSLSIKATKASVLSVESVEAQGYKIKDNGKLDKKRKAENIQLLRICFQVIPNPLSDAASELFHIRIINPAGETLYKTMQGSGILQKAEDNSSMKYTFSSSLTTPLEEMESCLDYEPKETLSEGTYLIEVYNKGFLSGTGEFRLK